MALIDFTYSGIDVKQFEDADLRKTVLRIHKDIHNKDCKFDNAWVDLPNSPALSAEMIQIKERAKWVRENCDVLLVVGVGGSYLGASAGIKMLQKFGDFAVEFLGTSFDAETIINFFERYKDKEVCVNIVSKSGTTMEIMAVFSVVDAFLREKYKSQGQYLQHLIITTDSNKGLLREFATKNKISSFVVPDRVGGRFSVLSAVGLLPFAVAGIDIDKIIAGARRAFEDCKDPLNNDAYRYALARYILHTRKNKSVEVLASFYDRMEGLGAWWQQLFGESEGKCGKGIYPSSLIYTRDLHSMGQYIQQGTPLLFETIINVENPLYDLEFARDGLLTSKIPAKSFSELNYGAFVGTVKAHSDIGVPVIIFNIQKMDCENFGYLVYFFQIACAMSCGLLDVNPYDQPGVEFYKKNMRDVLARR